MNYELYANLCACVHVCVHTYIMCVCARAYGVCMCVHVLVGGWHVA